MDAAMDDSWVSLTEEGSEENVFAASQPATAGGEDALAASQAAASAPPSFESRKSSREELRSSMQDASLPRSPPREHENSASLEPSMSSHHDAERAPSSDRGEMERAFPLMTLSMVPSLEGRVDHPEASMSSFIMQESVASPSPTESHVPSEPTAAPDRQQQDFGSPQSPLADELERCHARIAELEREKTEACRKAAQFESRAVAVSLRLAAVDRESAALKNEVSRATQRLNELDQDMTDVLCDGCEGGAAPAAVASASVAISADLSVGLRNAVNGVTSSVYGLADATVAARRELKEVREGQNGADSDSAFALAAQEQQTQQCLELASEIQAERLPTISFVRFAVGGIAIFFPTESGSFLAFNAGAPHNYLADESKELIGRDPHFRPYYVLGRIVAIEERTASGGRGGNPYGLADGTIYRVLFVASATADLTQVAGFCASPSTSR